MSSYYLCDTCAVPHRFNVGAGWWECECGLTGKQVMTDDYEHPHEVCPHWKEKEGE